MKSAEYNSALARPYANLAMAYALKGDDTKARAAAAEHRRLNPNDKLSKLNKPSSSSPVAYWEYWEKKLVPAWRKAGLPE